MKMLLIVLLTLTVSCALATSGVQQCERKWKKVGCFHDNVKKRVLPYELLNRRDPSNHNYDGVTIDWGDYPQSLQGIYCKCAELAEKKRYTHFGLQFYGECWSGPNATERFDMQGKSENCIGVDYNPCVDSIESECIGKESTNYIYQLVELNPCKKAIDLGFVVDSSGSVGSKNFETVKSFIKNISDHFIIGPSDTRFGVIHYSSNPVLDFTPRDPRYHEKAMLKEKIGNIAYLGGFTRTDRGLQLAERQFFCSGCNRAGKPKVLIVMTDGKTNRGSKDLGKVTNGMKKNDVTILSIGIGNKIDNAELELIASIPKKKHVFHLADFEQLKAKIESILVQACTAS